MAGKLTACPGQVTVQTMEMGAERSALHLLLGTTRTCRACWAGQKSSLRTGWAAKLQVSTRETRSRHHPRPDSMLALSS